MPVLTPTDISGRIVYLGRVADRVASMTSAPIRQVDLTFDGITGEAHSGATRPSCGRVQNQYPLGTEIRNVRQISILSVEDMTATAQTLGIPVLQPEWVGASLIVEGIPDLTLIPPSSRLMSEDGVGLVVDMENAPCTLTAREIEAHHPGVGKHYKAAARHRRGVTAWVERPGQLRIGDTLRLYVPPQRAYPPLNSD